MTLDGMANHPRPEKSRVLGKMKWDYLRLWNGTKRETRKI